MWFGFINEYWNCTPIGYNWSYNLREKYEFTKYLGIKKGITAVIPF
jgi:hypothetical protein